MMPGVVVVDLDGTLVREDTYLSFLLANLRQRPWRGWRCLWLPVAVAAHLTRFRDNSWLKRSFLTVFLGGLPATEVEAFGARFAERLVARQLRPGARQRLNAYAREGVRLVLATASLDLYVPAIARQLGIAQADVICTRTARDARGRLTGWFDGMNCYGLEKAARIAAWREVQGVSRIDIAYSDHHSDIPMLRLAVRGIAVNPSPRLRVMAEVEGFEIEDWAGPDSAALPSEKGFAHGR